MKTGVRTKMTSLSTIEIITGSLMDSPARYIAHQTNCVSERSAHLAKSMFEAFPHADVYSPRKSRAYEYSPGTIVVKGGSNGERYVINMMAQVFPGASRYPDSARDGLAARKKYFHSCLKQIALIQDLEHIAFPHGIGCGAAGGDWIWYSNQLQKFADHVKNNAKVSIVQLPEL